jgi:hypothetical protein
MSFDQTENTSGDKWIAKNAVMLYVRMLASMIVSFYTSRVVLNVLVVENDGTFGDVDGIVAMIAFKNGSEMAVGAA